MRVEPKKRLGYGLRFKILAHMIPLLALVTASLVGYFIVRLSSLMTENETKRIFSLARNLAFNSELGVAAENESFLQLPLQSTLRDPAIRSAAVYNLEGELVAGVPAGEVPARLSVGDLAGPIDPVTEGKAAGPLSWKEEPKAGLYEVVFPVCLRTGGARGRGGGPADEEDLLGFDEAGEGMPGRQPGKGDPRGGTRIGYARVAYTLGEIEAEKRHLLLSAGSISGLILLVGVFTSLVFARLITSSLGKLSRAVDEIGSLAEDFNRMLRRLREARRKIKDYQRNLEQKVRERTHALQKALEELRELDNMKDAFLATVSHELRTPLTSIRSFTEILLSYPDEDPATRQEFLGIILQESERLSLLIHDILDFSTIDGEKVDWKPEALGLKAMIDEVAGSMEGKLRERRLDLRIEVEDPLPKFTGDKKRIRQVLAQLVGNAAKFSPDGGRIEIRAALLKRKRREDTTDFLHVVVQDQGSGIPADELPKIFDRFKQGGDTLKDKPQGMGLGLAICRKILTYHGGKIWAESVEGEGSAFHILLPLRPVVGLRPPRDAAPEAEPPLALSA